MRLFFYSLGSLGLNLLQFFFVSHFLFYFDPKDGTTKMPLVWLSAILVVGRIFDGVSDPLIGKLNDRFQFKWGRKKTFLMIFFPITIISFFSLWRLPFESFHWNCLYLFFMVNVFFLSYTGYAIPYDAYLVEIAPQKKEKIFASAFKAFFALVGIFLAISLLGLATFETALLGALGISALSFVAVLPTVTDTHRSEKEAKWRWKEFIPHKVHLSFIYLIIFILCMESSLALFIKNLEYLIKHILMPHLGKTHESIRSTLLYSFIGALIISLPLWSLLGKKGTIKSLLIFSSVGLSLTGFFYVGIGMQEVTLPWIAALFVSGGFFFGGYTLYVVVAVAEFANAYRRLEKRHREGTHFGFFAFARKAGIVVSIVVFTSVVEIAEAWKITKHPYLIIGPLMSLFMLLGIWFLTRAYRSFKT